MRFCGGFAGISELGYPKQRVERNACGGQSLGAVLLPVDLRVADELDRQQVGARVEPDEELGALPLDRLGQPVGEERGGQGRLCAHVSEASA